MQQVSDLLGRLINRWTVSFTGLAVASLLVWYLGPLVLGFGGALPRALLILTAVIIWAEVEHRVYVQTPLLVGYQCPKIQ